MAATAVYAMRNSVRRIVWTTLLFCLGAANLAAALPYTELDGRVLDFRRGGGVTGWLPVTQHPGELTFVQGHVGFYRNFLFSESVGGGYRRFVRQDLVLGVNAFADFAQSIRGIGYYQGGIGLEGMGPHWEARFNGYIPSIKTNTRATGVVVQQRRIVLSTRRERSYGGLDGETGVGTPIGPGEGWVHAGYFFI